MEKNEVTIPELDQLITHFATQKDMEARKYGIAPLSTQDDHTQGRFLAFSYVTWRLKQWRTPVITSEGRAFELKEEIKLLEGHAIVCDQDSRKEGMSLSQERYEGKRDGYREIIKYLKEFLSIEEDQHAQS